MKPDIRSVLRLGDPKPTPSLALIITIQATVLGMLVAVTLGLLALLRRSPGAVVAAHGLLRFIEFGAQHAAAGADVLPVLRAALDRRADAAAGDRYRGARPTPLPPIARCVYCAGIEAVLRGQAEGRRP